MTDIEEEIKEVRSEPAAMVEEEDLDDIYDDDDDYNYEAVDLGEEDDISDIDEEENFQDAQRHVQMTKEREAPQAVRPAVTRQPEVVDDFIRNFLVKSGLTRTLDTFEAEWCEMQSRMAQQSDGISNMLVPDVYQQNAKLIAQIEMANDDLKRNKATLQKAQDSAVKFKKERDLHRRNHQRVVQEKGKLTKDLKRLETHTRGYDPMLQELTHKYESAMKTNMLIKLQMDKQNEKILALENTIRELEGNKPIETPKARKVVQKKHPTDSKLPDADRVNPYLNTQFKVPDQPFAWAPRHTYKGHTMSVCGLGIHPKGTHLVTGSDDKTWRLWSIPTGEVIMTGEGHKDWVSGIDFHPRGTNLVTGSGDRTVKIWDFSKGKCIHTFSDHSQGVWKVQFHDSGDFVVSASMDQTARLWDLHSHRCRATFRGHVDSVNDICLQPYGPRVLTASGDKTVSLWDIRSGYCTQSFFSHKSAVNGCAFSITGSLLASCDSEGQVLAFDLRNPDQPIARFDCGPHPANQVKFDRSGTFIAVASDDGLIKTCNLTDEKEGVKSMRGHEDAVLALVWDANSNFLISGGADATWRFWS
eukprot:TRINITY_DN68062_c5_g4_i1.p1 TRINITY_DN68062_c5_g4~~TRINITY_DN68062_c5_g4_i1.p1  ORF type:complete len:602 (-),score=53.96 TRINITY_DN68062_c5_g4_i1:1525-3279(-)